MKVLVFIVVVSLFSIARAADPSTVLDEINFARTHPQSYATILQEKMQSIRGADRRCVSEAISFLRRQRPLAPLQLTLGLVSSAQEHVAEQGPSGETGHNGSGGSTPWDRMARQGQWMGRAGENISYGYADARSIVVTLIVDQGVPGRGHRKNIFCPQFAAAGAACGAHARYGAMCVIDFAGGFTGKGETVAMAGP